MCGNPIMEWSIEQSQHSPQIDVTVITSDIPPEHITIHGEHIWISRPDELADDTASKWVVWKHVVDVVEERWGHTINRVDAICDLDPTQPLRTLGDIAGTVRAWDEEHDVVMAIAPAAAWLTTP